MALPTFKYHPDPISTESVSASETVCRVCGQARGYIYAGPVYAEEELVDCICPWCIADGSAHTKFEAEFTDLEGIGGAGVWDGVPEAVMAEVAQRTPGFTAWQSEQWFTHCGDAAAFVGRVGYKELKRLGPMVLEAFRDSAGIDEDDEDDYLKELDKDGAPTGYLFKCLHCGQYGGYADMD